MKRHGTHIGGLLALAALAGGCDVTRPLQWGFVDDSGLGPNEVYAATIWEDSCGRDEDIHFFGLLGGRTFDVPRISFSGEYCFEILAVDRDTCSAARGSQMVQRVDDDLDEITVTNNLGAIGPIACDGDFDQCVPGIGCLRCPRTMVLCNEAEHGVLPDGVDNSFCCNVDFQCETAGAGGVVDPEEDLSCIRIR